MNYFHIKQKNGRKTVYRVYQTDFKKCSFIAGFPSEEGAKALVKQLSKRY